MSKYDWLSYPWVAWPSGYIIGLLSGLTSSWIRAKIHSKRKEEYFNISCSNNTVKFEGQYNMEYNKEISSINILKDIFKYSQ